MKISDEQLSRFLADHEKANPLPEEYRRKVVSLCREVLAARRLDDASYRNFREWEAAVEACCHECGYTGKSRRDMWLPLAGEP